MSAFGILTTLVGASASLSAKKIYDKKQMDKGTQIAIKLYGLDRRVDQYEEYVIKQQYDYDWETGERLLYDPNLVDFFENGSSLARLDWVEYRVKEIILSKGMKPYGSYMIDTNHERHFVNRYEMDMFYWWHCREQGVKYKDVRGRCQSCGHLLKYIDEPCPVCGNPPIIKLTKTYRQVLQDKENEKIAQQKEIEESNERANAIGCIMIILCAFAVFSMFGLGAAVVDGSSYWFLPILSFLICIGSVIYLGVREKRKVREEIKKK